MNSKSFKIFINGLIAGFISCILAVLLNYYVLPFPDSIIANIVGHGVGSFFSGFFSAVIGIVIFTYSGNKN